MVVTGASSGIGEAAARLAAARGARVVLVARRAEQLARIADEINAQHPGRASAYPCDLTDADAVSALVEQVLADHGHVHYLVNNAGRSIRRSLALSYDRFHDIERTMAINFYAPARLTLAFLPGMREQGFGQVVNVLSWGVQFKAPKFSAYLASKAALDVWSRIAGRETLTDDVLFTNIRFGAVRTDMLIPTELAEDKHAMTAQQAGELVVRALERRPVTVNHIGGTPTELLNILAPRFTDKAMSRYDARSPDTAQARGEGPGAR